MSALFRQAALDRISHPDQLDQALRVVPPAHKIGLAVIGAVLAAGIVWSFLSTAPEKVAGQGVLLSAAGVAEVTAPDSGRIETLLVQPGDPVAEGQAVAVIRRPDVLDRLHASENELRGAREQIAMLKGMSASNQGLQNSLLAKKRQSLAARAATLDGQRATLVERRDNEEALRRRGFLSAMRVTETNTRIAEVENELASVRNSMSELDLQRVSESTRWQREISDAQLRAENLERQTENLHREYERDRTAHATTAGRVVEIGVNPGDMVSPGSGIMRLLPADHSVEGGLTAVVFVPATEGKKVKPGMDAGVVPSTVKAQKDGFILGRVSKVAELPATREGLMRRLKNAAEVEQLMRGGAPFEVEVALRRSDDTRSGYAWSSGRGPDITVTAGTVCQAHLVIDRTRIISLILPAFDHVSLWFKSL